MGDAYSRQTVKFRRSRSERSCEAAGISSELQGESLRNTHGLTLNGLGTVELVVAGADEDRARALLVSADGGEFRLDDAPRWNLPETDLERSSVRPARTVRQ
jgi:hypothetical protein